MFQKYRLNLMFYLITRLNYTGIFIIKKLRNIKVNCFKGRQKPYVLIFCLSN